MTLEERFLAKIKVNPETQCWEWTAYCNPVSGYGQLMTHVNKKPKLRTAHSISAELYMGERPPNMTIDHLCCNPKCANPSHLEFVSMAENIRRSDQKVVRCPRGHEYTEKNTYINPTSGSRQCNQCRKTAHRDAFKKKHPNYKRDWWAKNLEENRRKQNEYLAKKKHTQPSQPKPGKAVFVKDE